MVPANFRWIKEEEVCEVDTSAGPAQVDIGLQVLPHLYVNISKTPGTL